MTKIAGFFHVYENEVTRRFYAALGLAVSENQHGGPVHFEVQPFVAEPVFELYDAKSIRWGNTIMLEVDSIADALAVAKEFDKEPISPLLGGGNFRFQYITDPDDHYVMLIQKEG